MYINIYIYICKYIYIYININFNINYFFKKVGTESVTFLSQQDTNGTLYSIPGLYLCL